MIYYELLFAYIAAIITLIATPGPVVALVIKNALIPQNTIDSESTLKTTHNNATNSIKYALFTICGTNLGSLVLIAASIAVILGIAQFSSLALALLSLLGSCFILYLGASAVVSDIRARSKIKRLGAKGADSENSIDLNTDLNVALNPAQKLTPNHPKAASQTPRKCFTQGLLLSLSNPKDILFFVAFFPQFMGVADSLTLSVSILSVLWIIFDFSLLLGIVCLFQRANLGRFQAYIAKTADFLLIIIGLCGIVYGLLSLL